MSIPGTAIAALDVAGLPGSQVSATVDDAVATDRSVLVPTSGYSGRPKRVLLSMAALTASAQATMTALGGGGQWVAALSPERIGGLQVYVRSALSGIPAVAVAGDTSFGVCSFVAAVAALRSDGRRYVALVPTQVYRLLAEPAGREALASFDRVLIGGAPLPAAAVTGLGAAGVRWTQTYGMTETAGGCLYDGTPLPGVQVRLESQAEVGRIQLSGPMLARGYHQEPQLTEEAFLTEAGRRWFRTGDLGRYDPIRQRWQVLGRADDVVNTGGHKVHPDDVVSALSDLPGVDDAAVVGVPDAHWGERVVALLVPATDGSSTDVEDPTGWVRSRLYAVLPPYAIPAQVRWAPTLPRLAGGKVDTAGVRAAFIQEGERL
ncbi:MAG: AMP-binding protein [Ornithinimicrobium sp.]